MTDATDRGPLADSPLAKRLRVDNLDPLLRELRLKDHVGNLEILGTQTLAALEVYREAPKPLPAYCGIRARREVYYSGESFSVFVTERNDGTVTVSGSAQVGCDPLLAAAAIQAAQAKAAEWRAERAAQKTEEAAADGEVR